MAECKETRDLCLKLKRMGAITYAAVANRFSVPGWPDRWVGHRLWNGWLEFKTITGVLRADQKAQLQHITESCGHGSCWVIRAGDGSWESLLVEDHHGKGYGGCTNDPHMLLKLLNELKIVRGNEGG